MQYPGVSADHQPLWHAGVWTCHRPTPTKNAFVAALLIIPGPSEPSYLDMIFAPLIEDIIRLGPAGEGFLVVEYEYDEATSIIVPGFTITHKIIIGQVDADSPAARKLTNFLGHSAILGCGYCMLRGISVQGTVRFLGYAEPTQAGWQVSKTDALLEASCGDASCPAC